MSGAEFDAWEQGWRAGNSDGKRQMIDHAHPKTANPYLEKAHNRGECFICGRYHAMDDFL